MLNNADATTLLDIRNLSVDYAATNGVVHAVNDVSFTLKRGEILGVAGESGCGKSTMAYAITRLLRPPAFISEGQVLYYPPPRRERAPVNGTRFYGNDIPDEADDMAVDILELTTARLRHFRWNEISIVFQSAMNALNPVFSISAQIMDVLKTHRPGMEPDQRKKRVLELLNLVGIADDRVNSYPHELSGGMRQRAVIAIALALNPELIVMDEPTTALDVVVQREILQLMKSLCKDLSMSLIFITHDLSLLLELANRVIVMYAGKIVESASSKDLYLSPHHPYSYGLLSSFPNLRGPLRMMSGIPGSPPDLRNVPSGCSFHTRCPMAFEECQRVEPLLHQVHSDSASAETRLVSCLLYDSRSQSVPAPDLTTFAARYAVLTESEKKTERVVPLLNGSTSNGSATPVLEAIQLHKELPVGQRLFGASKVVHAVEDASFSLYPGQVTALVGESGSGKTTIARLLARLYDPTSGAIRFRGEPIKLVRNAPALRQYRRHVQLIFQDPFASLNPVHTIRYHLTRSLRSLGRIQTRRQETEQILSLLQRVNLTPADQFIQKYPHQLSGGQRQRIAIARTLAVHPDVLLADEPVSMLDVSIRLDILNLLSSLKEEEHMALLYITHDIASARYFANTILVMYAGQLVEGGPSEEITQRPKHPYTRLLLSATPDTERIKTATQSMDEMPARGEIPSLINPPTGCRFHLRCPHAMDVCRQQFPPRVELGGGHWTNCFLYTDHPNRVQEVGATL